MRTALFYVLLLGALSMCAMVRGEKQAWSEVARSGQLIRPEIIASAEKALGKLPGEKRRQATALLDEVAQVPRTGAGIAAARERLAAALPGFRDPKHKASGEDPHVADVKQCALVLLHGLLHRAGEGVRAQPRPDAAAAELLAAARGIEGFSQANRGSLLSELRLGLGPELYDRAAASLDGKGP